MKEQTLAAEIQQLTRNIDNLADASRDQLNDLKNKDSELYYLVEFQLLRNYDYKRAEQMVKGKMFKTLLEPPKLKSKENIS